MVRAAQIAHDRMVLAGNRGASAEALTLAATSAKWLKRYEDTGKPEPAEADALAIVYMNVGGRYVVAEQYDEAIRLCRRAAEIAHSVGSEPYAGSALMGIAESYRLKGDLDMALQTIRESARILEVPAGVVNRGRTMSLTNALSREGQILGEDRAISMGRSEEALVPLQRAFALAENSAHEDANDADSRSRVATSGIVLADILRHSDPSRAIDVYDLALHRLSEIHDNPRSRRQEVRILAGSSYPLRRLGRHAEARRRIDLAFQKLSQLKIYPSDRIRPGSEADETMCALADHEADRGDVRHAIELYEDLLRRVQASDPKPESSLADALDLSRLHASLSALYRRAHEDGLASAEAAKRLDLWRRWDARLPGNTFVRRQLDAAAGLFSGPLLSIKWTRSAAKKS
jgi:tetratricopeptide (TPR) repeat protein